MRVDVQVQRLAQGGARRAQLDMPSWRTLSYVVRQYLGVGTSAVRTADAFERALAQFRAQFSALTRAPVQPSPLKRHLSA